MEHVTTRSDTSSASGFALPLVLALLIIMGGFTARYVQTVSRLTVLMGNEIQRTEAKLVAQNSAINHSASFAAHLHSRSEISCLNGTAQFGRIDLNRQLCALYPSSQTLFMSDFDQLFSKPSPCELIVQSPHAGLASAALPACTNPLSPADRIFRGNIELNGLAVVPPSEAPATAPYILAALGFVHIHGTLQIDRPLILIAGEDIEIDRMTGIGGSATLFSARGALRIQSIDRAISIYPAARSVEIPSDSARINFNLAPKLPLNLLVPLSLGPAI